MIKTPSAGKYKPLTAISFLLSTVLHIFASLKSHKNLYYNEQKHDV